MKQFGACRTLAFCMVMLRLALMLSSMLPKVLIMQCMVQKELKI